MMDERHVPDIGLSEPARRALGEHLAPPGGDRYWDGLASRIRARLEAGAPAEWWVVLSGWSRVGLVAAGVLIALAGAALVTASAPDAVAAYQAVVVEPPPSVPPPVTSGASPADPREQTLQVIISY